MVSNLLEIPRQLFTKRIHHTCLQSTIKLDQSIARFEEFVLPISIGLAVKTCRVPAVPLEISEISDQVTCLKQLFLEISTFKFKAGAYEF